MLHFPQPHTLLKKERGVHRDASRSVLPRNQHQNCRISGSCRSPSREGGKNWEATPPPSPGEFTDTEGLFPQANRLMLQTCLPHHMVPLNTEYRCARLIRASILKARIVLLKFLISCHLTVSSCCWLSFQTVSSILVREEPIIFVFVFFLSFFFFHLLYFQLPGVPVKRGA